MTWKQVIDKDGPLDINAVSSYSHGVNLRKVVLISFLYDALVRSFGARVMWYRMFCGSIFVVDHNKANSRLPNSDLCEGLDSR
jgi:hypothetical protein